MATMLIADSGSSKTEWCLIAGGKKKNIITQGLSPYFLNEKEITDIVSVKVKAVLKDMHVDQLYFYGTGCSNMNYVKMFSKIFKLIFKGAIIEVQHDLMAAARALCGHSKGIACILGTGSNSCFFNGKRITKNSPGLGFVLGDEGSGAYLGKKVLQYYLYNTFDADLMDRFNEQYKTNKSEILHAVYKETLPNKYLASFAIFLKENRGHFMIENIIEDGLNDFFFNHVYKFKECWTMPVNFTGSVAWGFSDVLQDLCNSYALQLGKVEKTPMPGLVAYHTTK